MSQHQPLLQELNPWGNCQGTWRDYIIEVPEWKLWLPTRCWSLLPKIASEIPGPKILSYDVPNDRIDSGSSQSGHHRSIHTLQKEWPVSQHPHERSVGPKNQMINNDLLQDLSKEQMNIPGFQTAKSMNSSLLTGWVGRRLEVIFITHRPHPIIKTMWLHQ